MSVKINYEFETVTIPAKAIPAMERAATSDIRLLMALCADSQLRQLPENDFASFAAAAGCTEAQAAASLAFWRGAGILITDRNSTGRGDVSLPSPLPPLSSVSHASTFPVENSASSVYGPLPAMASDASSGDATEVPKETEAGMSAAPSSESHTETAVETAAETASVSKPSRHDQLPIYTTEQVTGMLEAHPDTAAYLDESAKVWGKIFNTHEVNILLGLVDYLGLEWEYVLILLAYCKKILERRGSARSLHYVETVAFGFYDEGIHTPEALQEKIRQLDLMAETESKLRTMFGIGSRALTATEKRYFSVWLYEFQYTVDIIHRAFEITVDAIGEPKLKYMNTILSKWSAQKLHTVEAIDAFQQESDRSMGKGKTGTGKKTGSSFDTDDFFGDAVRRSFGDDFDANIQETES